MLGIARHERPPEPICACDLLVGQSIGGRHRVRVYSCAVGQPLHPRSPPLVPRQCFPAGLGVPLRRDDEPGVYVRSPALARLGGPAGPFGCVMSV
jgi:hypothetical protein